MKELKFNDNWNGGSFNFSTADVIGRVILICSPENIELELATVNNVIKRFGTDYDHGHEYSWENVDYCYRIEHDTFDRGTKLLDLFKRGFHVYLKD